MAQKGPSTSKHQQGETSLSFCGICLEKKEKNKMFTVEGCSHYFCNDCVAKHVAAKIQENLLTVKCPAADCRVALEFGSCKSIISKDVLAKWDKLLCESTILESQKFYCPYKDCSAMLLRDGNEEVIKESECPVCHRLFCAECYVGWHSGFGCEDFQKLNKDERGREDIMLRELAKAKEWNRCPCCKIYVEKTQGCLHMTCRCGYQFCYRCGATWSSTHGSCERR